MESITIEDLILINNLSSRIYSDNKFSSNGSDTERIHLRKLTLKLKNIADFFSYKYNLSHGPFVSSVSTGNPIAIGGKKFKRVWSGIFKGNINKQYAAQISFVMNPIERCLDVGFYFGRASGHNVKDKRHELESQLKKIGEELSNAISNNKIISERYNELFDKGFTAISESAVKLPEEWVNSVNQNPKHCQIIKKIFPNEFNEISIFEIDYCVAEVIFLMSIVNSSSRLEDITIPPLSPEQWARRAQRMAEIGLKGELHVMELEKQRLNKFKIKNNGYPKHVALESMHYGYDILSLDNLGKEIYIEVKSTTRSKADIHSKKFFLSDNEYQKSILAKEKYKIYRIYNVEDEAELEVLDLSELEINSNGYCVTYS